MTTATREKTEPKAIASLYPELRCESCLYLWKGVDGECPCCHSHKLVRTEDIPVMQCVKCWYRWKPYVYYSRKEDCPNCGSKWLVEVREIKQGELKLLIGGKRCDGCPACSEVLSTGYGAITKEIRDTLVGAMI